MSKGFRYFTVNSPRGTDHLLHSVPPWDHRMPTTPTRGRSQGHQRTILSPEPSFRAPLRPSPSNEEYKEYHGGDDPGPGRTRIVKAISFHE